MQQNNKVSFFAPGFDDAIEQQKIERQRKLAEAMLQQSQGTSKGQMVGQMYIPPHWSEGIARVAQAYLGAKKNADADTQQTALAQAMQTRNQQEAKDFFATLRGTPGQSFGNGVLNDDDGNVMPVPADKAAIPGDQNRAIEMAFNAKSPMVQAYGGQLATGQLQQQQMIDKIAAAFKMAGIGAPAGGEAGQPAGGAPAGSGAPASLGGVNPTALALTLSGDPTLAKAGGLVADASKPITAREGDVLVPDGKGGFRSVWAAPKAEAGINLNRGPGGQVTSANSITGYAEAAAEIKRAGTKATEGVKADLDMVTVHTPNGPVMMTRAEAARQAGGGQQPPVPAARPPVAAPAPVRPANPLAPQPGDSDRTAIFEGEMLKAQERLANAKTPEEKQRAENDIAGLRRETKAAGIPLQAEGKKAFETKMGTEQADLLTKSHTAAQAASDELVSISEAKKATARGVYQSSGANMKLGIAKFINANIPGVTVNPEKVGDTDYLKSVLGKGLLEQAKALGSNPSNADAGRIDDIVGSLTKDPLAMLKILDWRQMMAERAIDLHNTKVDQSEKNGFKPQFDMRIKPPGTGKNSVLDQADAILRGGN